MRYVVLALALLPAAAVASENDIATLPSQLAQPGKVAKPAVRPFGCENARVDYTVQREEPVRIRNLGQEPLAAQYLGVVRTEDGCDKPVKISDRVGDKQR